MKLSFEFLKVSQRGSKVASECVVLTESYFEQNSCERHYYSNLIDLIKNWVLDKLGTY